MRKSMVGENNPAWLGGHTAYRGGNWNTQRKLARKRDKDTCQDCGLQQKSLPVHHVIPYHLFDHYSQANQLDNLRTLCPKCHSIADMKYWASHPDKTGRRHFPDVIPIRNCRNCGKQFNPRSSFAKLCDLCCTATCEHCGKSFYSRDAAHRKIKYCSRQCRNDHVRRSTPQKCVGCGTDFIADRPRVQYCSNQCRMTKGNPRRLFFAKLKKLVQG